MHIFGRNVVVADGDEWRRHLAIAGPAFSDSNTALTWQEALRVMKGFVVEELEGEANPQGGSERVDVLAKLTQATLHVIASAGFGMSLAWSAFSEGSSGKAEEKEKILPFHESIQTSIRKLPVPILIPRLFKTFRVPWLSEQLDIFDKAYSSLNVHMRNLANVARHDHTHDLDHHDDFKADLLRRLVKANEAMKGSTDSLSMRGTLTDEEMFSNIFVSLFPFIDIGLSLKLLLNRCSCWLDLVR